MSRVEVPASERLDAEFDHAFEQLTELVDLSDVEQRFPRRGNAVYTTSVVLWMLVYQRMNPDTTLAATVKRLLDTKPAFLPDNKRVRERKLSPNSAGYSKARSQVPLESVRHFAEFVSDSIIHTTDGTFDGRRVFLLDGTTIKLAPEPELQQAFPPASNQYGEGVWPIAHIVVAHELSSGAALLPEVGCMYGPDAVSEVSLIHQHLAALPVGSIVMADAGFGIFSVAWSAAQRDHSFFLRMSKQHFTSLTKQADLIDDDDGVRSWKHTWTPTAKVRTTNPLLPDDAAVDVMLHEIRINENLTLFLVTDLDATAAELADLYARRVDVEVDIRNLKVVLDAENIEAKSVDTVLKELYAAVISYNLVSQFRRQAARLIDEPPRRMSFKNIWRTYRIFLLDAMFTEPSHWREKYREALSYATMDKLPNRPGRSFKREAYQKRNKSSEFEKRAKRRQI